MSYTSNSNRPNEYASKSSHSHVINDPTVSDYLSTCALPKEQTEVLETDVTPLIDIGGVASDLQHVIAIDGGYTEAIVKKKFPSSKIAFFQFGALFFDLEHLQEISDSEFIFPEDMAKFKQLEYQKREAEVRNLNAPSMSAEDKAYQEARGRNRAEAEASRMPGTKEYLAGQEEITRKNKLNSIIQENAETALEAAKIAKPKIGYFSTGLPGQLLSNVGGTDAKDLEEALRPIKALTGFDKLQELREMSKTGGALGQVAVEELRFLQSVKGSLDTAQSEQQFRQILSNVEKYYEGKRNIGTAARSPVSGAESQAMLMQEAQRAIAAGAPRDAVMQRLQEKMRGQ